LYFTLEQVQGQLQAATAYRLNLILVNILNIMPCFNIAQRGIFRGFQRAIISVNSGILVRIQFKTLKSQAITFIFEK
jgi:hypothetical protein